MLNEFYFTVAFPKTAGQTFRRGKKTIDETCL